VHITLSAGDIQIDTDVNSSDDANWHYETNISVESIDKDTTISFTWEYSFMGAGAYTMYTDGSSYITFPVALDTDGDGIPDTMDTDDDNDGYTDAEEEEAGTDPLDPNSYPEEKSRSNSDSGNPLPGFEGALFGAAVPTAIIAMRRRR